jgi:hypothetical protein
VTRGIVSRRTAVRGGAVVLALLWALPAAHAQLPPSDARCRNGLGKGVQLLAKTLLLAQATCHELRSQGTLPASVDCNYPMQSPSIAKIQHAAARLTTLAGRRCAAASAPAALGYISCPYPCTGPISDYPSVGDCFACITQHWLATRSRLPTEPNRPYRSTPTRVAVRPPSAPRCAAI